MPWYYAGPEAKPLGPVSAEQLQALLASGTITPETFVIEHTGPGATGLAWKRYREAFPPAAPLPPIPPAVPAAYSPPPIAVHPAPAAAAPVPPAPPAPLPGAIPAPVPSAPAASAPHPLFPSSGQAAYPAGYSPAGYPPIRPTNSWCAWGFALSLVGFCFSFVCGIGLFPALAGVVLSIIGLVQVHKKREQEGQGLAIAGLVFSGVALLVAIFLIALFVPSILKAHGLTVTEQTSNDSE